MGTFFRTKAIKLRLEIASYEMGTVVRRILVVLGEYYEEAKELFKLHIVYFPS